MRGWSLLLALALVVGHVGCSNDFDSCKESRTCSDGAGGEGGQSGGSGGTSTGAGGAGVAGGAGGAADMCPSGLTLCDESCVDTDASSEHCGGCGQVCDDEEVCMMGSCELTCSNDMVACDRTCIDPETNDDFCGASGTCTDDDAGDECSNDEACVGGECLGNDPTLASLTVAPGALSPEFDPDETAYVVLVPRFFPVVSLSAKASDGDATLEIDGDEVDGGDPVEFDVPIEGMVAVTIEVTAPTGVTETYEVVLVGAEATSTYLKASNAAGYDSLGWTVALDGDTLVVGAPGEDSIDADEDDNSATNAGAVYVFVRNDDGEWEQQAYIKAPNAGQEDSFGTAVALDGDTLAVGAPGEDGDAAGAHGEVTGDGNNGIGYGAVYVFRRSGSDWELEAYVKSLQVLGPARGGFGSSVALDGDTLAVGEPNEQTSVPGVFEPGDIPCCDFGDTESGAVSIYTRGPSGWEDGVFIKAPNAAQGDRFGSSVALDGDLLAVAAPDEDGSASEVQTPENLDDNDDSANSGAVYLYSRSDGEWAAQAYVKAPNVGIDDEFGFSIALSGGILAVGTPLEDSDATQIETDINEVRDNDNDARAFSGAVYVYTFEEPTWTFNAYVKATNAQGSDRFGASVALDNGILVVGADNEATDSSGVLAPGDLPSAGGPQGGAAYAFAQTRSGWRFQALIKADAPDEDEQFGFAVAASGDTIVVGANFDAGQATGVNGDPTVKGAFGAGAVYVYR